MSPLEELAQLYFQTSRATMTRDFARAIALFKSLPDDETRERAAVYMDGLAQMRSEWGATRPGTRPPHPNPANRAATRPGRARA